jgi:hypothetical protein
VEWVNTPERALRHLLEVFAAEQLLLELALQRGRKVGLVGGLVGWAVEGLGDHRESAGDVEHPGGAFLDQQDVVLLALTVARAWPSGGQQGDRAADAEAIVEGQG